MKKHTTGASVANPRPVSLATMEKRLRRYLAKTGWSLVKSRPNTKQHEVLGDYSIFDDSYELVADKISLAARARSYGLLADDEIIEEGGRHD